MVFQASPGASKWAPVSEKETTPGTVDFSREKAHRRAGRGPKVLKNECFGFWGSIGLVR